MNLIRRILQRGLAQNRLLMLIIGMIPVLLFVYFVKRSNDINNSNKINDDRMGELTDNRNPASFEEISDSDVPAKTIYSSTRLDSPKQIHGAVDGGRSLMRQPLSAIYFAKQIQFEKQKEHSLSNASIVRSIEFRLGLTARRARAVKFDAAVLEDLKQREAGAEYLLPLQLFPDFERMIRLKVISGFEVNKGLHSGVIEGDATSKVQLAIEGQAVSAFIESSQGRFRIVYDPLAQQHYVVELK